MLLKIASISKAIRKYFVSVVPGLLVDFLILNTLLKFNCPNTVSYVAGFVAGTLVNVLSIRKSFKQAEYRFQLKWDIILSMIANLTVNLSSLMIFNELVCAGISHNLT
jgi:hypothetical protein